jgi:hypothetical protein
MCNPRRNALLKTGNESIDARKLAELLRQVKPPTGKPYAGDPLVRFGGRGSSTLSLPLSLAPDDKIRASALSPE